METNAGTTPSTEPTLATPPTRAMPNDVMPNAVPPIRFMPNEVMPDTVPPTRTMPNNAMPNAVPPMRTMPNTTMPNNVILNRMETNRMDLVGFPLAMAYSPYQMWEDDVYTEDVGLSRGTIFPGLDKPFIGKECSTYGRNGEK